MSNENIQDSLTNEDGNFTMDGMKWAETFCQMNPQVEVDIALAWFCNAVMAGYDEANRRNARQMREFVGFLSADVPELHTVEVPRLAESLDRFLQVA